MVYTEELTVTSSILNIELERTMSLEFYRGEHHIARLYWHKDANKVVLRILDDVVLMHATLTEILKFMDSFDSWLILAETGMNKHSQEALLNTTPERRGI